jgi:hypothetical protein
MLFQSADREFQNMWGTKNISSNNPPGLTLVELLVVLFIVGLGWFSLLPRLDPTNQANSDDPLTEMNTILNQVRHKAFVTGRFQEVRIDHLQGRLFWNEESLRFRSPIARCTINTVPCQRPASNIRIYPPGYMDQLDLVFASGERWTTMDLDVRMLATSRL